MNLTVLSVAAEVMINVYKTSPGQMGEGGLGVSEGEDFGFCPQTTILLKSQSCYAIGSGELVESD